MWRSNDVEALGCLSDALRDEDCGVLPLEWALWARLRPARYLRVMDDRRPPLSVRSRRRTRRAGRCSPPHGAAAGCRSSAAAENAYFLTESGCESVKKHPDLLFGNFLQENLYHLLSPKGGAKSVRRAKKSGNGRRLAPKTLRGRARARVFDGASAARSSSRFFAMRSCCALRATMIICWCLFLAVLWPARMHCFRYFRSAIPQASGLPCADTCK